jgi:hypothetical protein
MAQLTDSDRSRSYKLLSNVQPLEELKNAIKKSSEDLYGFVEEMQNEINSLESLEGIEVNENCDLNTC